MQVKFIKDHLNHKAGDNAELTRELANYLVRVGVATTEDKPVEKEVKPKRTARKKK